jgi:class 3 adenylate cyclase
MQSEPCAPGRAGVAEPNSVVIAESTRKLVGNLFELEDLGTKDLKGIAGPMRAMLVDSCHTEPLAGSSTGGRLSWSIKS